MATIDARVTRIVDRASREAERAFLVSGPHAAAAQARLQALLVDADALLGKKMQAWLARSGGASEAFTAAQVSAYQAQIRLAAERVEAMVQQQATGHASTAWHNGAQACAIELQDLEQVFTGISRAPRLRQAMRFDPMHGKASSVLRSIETSVDRYGTAMIGQFERTMALGMAAGLTQFEMVELLTAHGGPRGTVSMRARLVNGVVVRTATEQIAEGLFNRHRSWAWRIVRTETSNAYNAAKIETLGEFQQDIPNLKKKILAHFDSRTAPDSVAVHGQIRDISGPNAFFVDGAGRSYEHPPARPNDRETVIPWIPDEWDEVPSTRQLSPDEVGVIDSAIARGHEPIDFVAQRAADLVAETARTEQMRAEAFDHWSTNPHELPTGWSMTASAGGSGSGYVDVFDAQGQKVTYFQGDLANPAAGFTVTPPGHITTIGPGTFLDPLEAAQHAMLVAEEIKAAALKAAAEAAAQAALELEQAAAAKAAAEAAAVEAAQKAAEHAAWLAEVQADLAAAKAAEKAAQAATPPGAPVPLTPAQKAAATRARNRAAREAAKVPPVLEPEGHLGFTRVDFQVDPVARLEASHGWRSQAGTSIPFDAAQIESHDVQFRQEIGLDGTTRTIARFKVTSQHATAVDAAMTSHIEATRALEAAQGREAAGASAYRGTDDGAYRFTPSNVLSNRAGVIERTATGPTNVARDSRVRTIAAPNGARIRYVQDTRTTASIATAGDELLSVHNLVEIEIPSTDPATVIREFGRHAERIGLRDPLARPSERAQRDHVRSRILARYGGELSTGMFHATATANEAGLELLWNEAVKRVPELETIAATTRAVYNGEGSIALYSDELARQVEAAGMQRLTHHGSGNDENGVVNILKSMLGEPSGMAMISTNERWHRGMTIARGQSSDRDVQTGGADGFFMRYQKDARVSDAGGSTSFRFQIRPAEAARLDMYSFGFDNYGRAGPMSRRERLSMPTIQSRSSFGGGDEQISRYGVHRRMVTEVSVGTERVRTRVIEELRKAGVTHFEGRTVESVIVVR